MRYIEAAFTIYDKFYRDKKFSDKIFKGHKLLNYFHRQLPLVKLSAMRCLVYTEAVYIFWQISLGQDNIL